MSWSLIVSISGDQDVTERLVEGTREYREARPDCREDIDAAIAAADHLAKRFSSEDRPFSIQMSGHENRADRAFVIVRVGMDAKV